jgi:hypothetical protein
MLSDIKILAKESLENKWGEGRILDISEDFTYSCEKIDSSDGEIYLSIVNIKEACSFCYDALKRAMIQSETHIDDKIDVVDCSQCMIPHFVCNNKGTEGLVGMLSRLFTKYSYRKDQVIWIINLVRDCIRQLRNFGRISLHTERFINSIEVK